MNFVVFTLSIDYVLDLDLMQVFHYPKEDESLFYIANKNKLIKSRLKKP